MSESTGAPATHVADPTMIDPEPSGICLVPHPLLEDVRCQRLQGHPGTHGAEVETRSAEIYLEWTDESESPD